MSLIQFGGAGFDHAGTFVFRNVTFTLSRGERWGVVGRNGSGKTTMFRLATGAWQPTEGNVTRASGLRIAVLDQHRAFEGAVSVWDAVAAPFASLLVLERSLGEQADALAHDASAAALAKYDEDLHRFEREGGYTFRARVDAVLEGLGFNAERAHVQAVEQLSGGERGRAGLARQLVAPADVFLLDEPTNHLDLETTRWLEEYLPSAGVTLMAISHDRAFLDRVADHILHFEACTAFAYDAGYAAFVEQRAERRLSDQRSYDQQQRRISAEEDYIRRNIAGQNSRQAKGRRTRLARLPRLSAPAGEDDVMALRLEARERGGDQVVVFEDVRLEIGGRVLLDDFSARVRRSERVGLVGPNGTGKSTLLRTIDGERETAAGVIRVGESIRVAHYRQDLAQVPAEKTLFNAIHELRPLWDRGKVQGHLGRFGFSGEEVQRVAGTLSGGELARLALALIVLEGANLLLFDEPTNHLDIESIETLEDALSAYDGTVILVSHDRALLRALTTRTWSLRDARIEDYPGSFEEWEGMDSARSRRARAHAAEADAEARLRGRAQGRRAQEAQKRTTSDVRSARRELQDAETRVHGLEARVEELTAQLHDEGMYGTAEGALEAARIQTELESLRLEVEAAYARWAAATEDLERVSRAS
jgi:ATP-binding cassette subfamily F protein 3